MVRAFREKVQNSLVYKRWVQTCILCPETDWFVESFAAQFIYEEFCCEVHVGAQYFICRRRQRLKDASLCEPV